MKSDGLRVNRHFFYPCYLVKIDFLTCLCLLFAKKFCYTRGILLNKRGIMRKISIFLAILLTLSGGVVSPGMVAAIENEERDQVYIDPNYIAWPGFGFTRIRTGANGLNFEFNGIENGVSRYGLWDFYVAAYDYDKVTMAEADSRIRELGKQDGTPSWAKWSDRVYGGLDKGAATATTRFDRDDGIDIADLPGVLYYALHIRDNQKSYDDPEYFWVWGKLQYRDCAYNGDSDPYMAVDCRLDPSKDEKHYNFQAAWATDTSKYVPWSVEWGATLTERLGKVEEEIMTWEGDSETEKELRSRLSDTRLIAEDADNTEEIRTIATRLEELLDKRTSEIEEAKRLEEEKRKEEEEKKKQEEEQKRKEEEEKLRQEEEQKRKEEEEKRKQEEEQKRLEEEQKKKAEEKRKQEEAERRRQEELRRQEESKKQEEAEKLRQEEQKNQQLAATIRGDNSAGNVVKSVVTNTALNNENVDKDEGEAGELGEKQVAALGEAKQEVQKQGEDGINVPTLYSADTTWKWLLWPIIATVMIVIGLALRKIWKRSHNS